MSEQAAQTLDHSEQASPPSMRWTVSQAALWILTRDQDLVDGIDERCRHSLVLTAMSFSSRPVSPLAASRCLRAALSAGRFNAWARRTRTTIDVHTNESSHEFLDKERTPIPQSFWEQEGGDFTDNLTDTTAAASVGPTHWSSIVFDADDIVAHWQPPTSVLEGHPLSLRALLDGALRLLTDEDLPAAWFVTLPTVIVTGINSAGLSSRIERSVLLDSGFQLDAGRNAIQNADGIRWSSVMIGLAEVPVERARVTAEATPSSSSTLTAAPAESAALELVTKEVIRRREAGERHGRDELVPWLRGEMSEVGEREARRIFQSVPEPLRKQRQGRRPGKRKSGQK